MPFRPSKKQPQFADLKGILSQSKKTDNALYQTVQVLIERLSQLQEILNEDISTIQDPTNPLSNVAPKTASYHTKFDDRAVLPNSIQLLAGLGITFDDSVVGKRTINSSGGLGNHYDAPLTDGHLVEAELIFAAGECIIVQVPV